MTVRTVNGFLVTAIETARTEPDLTAGRLAWWVCDALFGACGLTPDVDRMTRFIEDAGRGGRLDAARLAELVVAELGLNGAAR
jgi:hypothetical protein